MKLKFIFEKYDYLDLQFILYKNSKYYMKNKIKHFIYTFSLLVIFLIISIYLKYYHVLFPFIMLLITFYSLVYFLYPKRIFYYKVKRKIKRLFYKNINARHHFSEKKIEIKDNGIFLWKSYQEIKLMLLQIINTGEHNNLFYSVISDGTYVVIYKDKIIEGDYFTFNNYLKDV